MQNLLSLILTVTSVTSFVGQPSLFGSDLTLDYLANMFQHDALPEELMILMQAFRFTNRANCVMSGREARSGKLLANETSVLLRMLEREFIELYNKLQTKSGGVIPQASLLKLIVLKPTRRSSYSSCAFSSGVTIFLKRCLPHPGKRDYSKAMRRLSV